MAHSVEQLHRFGLKIFAEPPTAIDPRAIVPVFHRWIQTHAVDGLLIDVADYTHLVNGPSVLLVAHEAHYAVDLAEGRPGLTYTRKQATDDPLADRLVHACRALLNAGRLLEADTSRNGGFTFRGDELQFFANDRLAAPATAETEAGLRQVLSEFGSRVFGASGIEITRQGEPTDRLTFAIKAADGAPVDALLTNIGSRNRLG